MCAWQACLGYATNPAVHCVVSCWCAATVNTVLAGSLGLVGSRHGTRGVPSLQVALAVGRRVEDMLRNQRLALELKLAQKDRRQASKALEALGGKKGAAKGSPCSEGGEGGSQQAGGEGHQEGLSTDSWMQLHQAKASLQRAHARVHKLRKLQRALSDSTQNTVRFSAHALRRSVDAVLEVSGEGDQGNSLRSHRTGWSTEYLTMVRCLLHQGVGCCWHVQAAPCTNVLALLVACSAGWWRAAGPRAQSGCSA